MEQMMEYVPNMYATFWALVPPLVAIILALVTKEFTVPFYRNCNRRIILRLTFFSQGFSFEKSVLLHF